MRSALCLLAAACCVLLTAGCPPHPGASVAVRSPHLAMATAP